MDAYQTGRRIYIRDILRGGDYSYLKKFQFTPPTHVISNNIEE